MRRIFSCLAVAPWVGLLVACSSSSQGDVTENSAPRAQSLPQVHSISCEESIRLTIEIQNGTPEGLPKSAWRVSVESDGVQIATAELPRFTHPDAMLGIIQRMIEAGAESKGIEIDTELGPQDAWLDVSGPTTRITWTRIEPSDARDELKLVAQPRRD